MNSTPKREIRPATPEPALETPESPTSSTPGAGAANEAIAATVPASDGDDAPSSGAKAARAKGSRGAEAPRQRNNVRQKRQEKLMSKAELARRAGVSPLTIDRVESGYPCRMDTKRKILEALGMSPHERATVFPDIDQT